jgi:choline kinase
MRQLSPLVSVEDLSQALAHPAGAAEIVDIEESHPLPAAPAHSNRLATGSRHITTALLLAAGAGSRLGSGSPKCLAGVSGVPILGRLVSSLIEQGFERLVVVVGYRGDEIRDYLDVNASGLEIHFIDSRHHATTNNIYSLWLARDSMKAPFVLIESDLVFDSRLLGLMRISDRIAVAKLRPHMHGTTVSIDAAGRVDAFRVGALDGLDLPYKTVNIYSLSMSIWNEVTRRLDRHISAGRVHTYYESVFAEMAIDGLLPLEAVNFDDGRWSEIDSPNDLVAAQHLFLDPPRMNGA